MRVQAAIDGQGLVLVSSPLIQVEIGAGYLVEPFDTRLRNLGYYLVYQQQPEKSRAFRLFRQWLRQQVDAYTRSMAAGT